MLESEPVVDTALDTQIGNTTGVFFISIAEYEFLLIQTPQNYVTGAYHCAIVYRSVNDNKDIKDSRERSKEKTNR